MFPERFVTDVPGPHSFQTSLRGQISAVVDTRVPASFSEVAHLTLRPRIDRCSPRHAECTERAVGMTRAWRRLLLGRCRIEPDRERVADG
jgi:hypothetical protein